MAPAPRVGSKPPATSRASAARRFAWAPVKGARAYRFELFRGPEQVLVRRTETPALQLPPSWQTDGRRVTLEPGDYRWYVWPVLPDGVAAGAVMQARLTVR